MVLSKVVYGAETVTVHMNPTCSCCKAWVSHIREAGFTVLPVSHMDMDEVKEQLAVPGRLESCHTAIVGGYIVEGHVPSEDIVRLLAERPDIRGIYVPGMPVGSPGMEQNNDHEPYNVLALDRDGEVYVFAEHVTQ